MILVKLNAINSTNTYLKELSKSDHTKSWTVVTAEYQHSGRGQMQSAWVSEKGKNLICSILIRFEQLNIEHQFYLNCAISLGVLEALKGYHIPGLKVKWPNDIMSVSKKMGGILIENTVKQDLIYQSVVGIGLNVNQVKFPEHLPNPVSVKQLLGRPIDRDQLLKNLVTCIKNEIKLLNQVKFKMLLENYENKLFKKDAVHMFEDQHQKKFMAKLCGVSEHGLLQLEDEDGHIRAYNFKEIKFL